MTLSWWSARVKHERFLVLSCYAKVQDAHHSKGCTLRDQKGDIVAARQTSELIHSGNEVTCFRGHEAAVDRFQAALDSREAMR